MARTCSSLARAQSISVCFVTVVDLLAIIHRDAKEDRLDHRLEVLCRPKLLILDGMGYFPLDRLGRPVPVSTGQPPLLEREHHPDPQQVLRRLGRHLCRSSPGGGHPGPPAPFLDHHQHPRPELSAAERRKAGVFHELDELKKEG